MIFLQLVDLKLQRWGKGGGWPTQTLEQGPNEGAPDT
jgi:hypothetical protein